MKLSRKVCTMDSIFSWLVTWFPCFHSFLCSEIHLSKMAILMFRNDFFKKSQYFLPFKYTALHHTHFQDVSSLYFASYGRYRIAFTINTKFTTNHKVMVGFYSFPQLSHFPHFPLYVHIFYVLWTGEETWAWIVQTRVYTSSAWSMDMRWTWDMSAFVPGLLQTSKVVLDPGHEERTWWRSLGHTSVGIRAVIPKGIDTSTVQTWNNPHDLAWHQHPLAQIPDTL